MSFPRPAEVGGVYRCGQCGADLTKFMLRRRSSHGGPAIGVAFRSCRCGWKYETGYVEWEHLSYEQQKRMSDDLLPLLLLALLICVIIGVPATLVFGGWKIGLLAGAVAGFLVALCVKARFWFRVAASRRRTMSDAL